MAYVSTSGERRDSLLSNFPHANYCALFMLDQGLEEACVDEVRTPGKCSVRMLLVKKMDVKRLSLRSIKSLVIHITPTNYSC